MKQASTCIRSLALTAVVWCIFSWPLLLHLTTAIPSGSGKAAHSVPVTPMQPGDHLQLEYHFWLFGDMLRGSTPWFQNVYEFNTGDDAERYEPGAYYLPFSFVHAVGSLIAGRAFGWNLAGFAALWLTAWFTYLLARRYTEHPAAAWFAAAIAIAMPYRWINITGGSPTGFAMAFVPLVLLGIDIAVREDKLRGGLAAGLALLMAGWSDPHTFFFCALATPAWCLFAFVHRTAFDVKSWRSYARLAVTLAPIAVFASLAYLSNATNTKHIGEARSAIRTLPEIGLFSPAPEGLWSWTAGGVSEHIYLGIVAPCAAAALLLAGPRRWKNVATWLMLAAALFLVIELALGPNGIHGGYFFRLARRFIEPYGMIRQPAKAFCLAPTLIALVAALGICAFRSPRAAACILGALMLLEWRLHVAPRVGSFDLESPAYAAVAAAGEAEPRAVVAPLWPGDSHYTSVYEHDASLYRVRMLNGYRPYVSTGYIALVRSLESINQGVLDDGQLADLQNRGIGFVVFHENLFPEKVSVFPSSFTLGNLLRHPRLELLTPSGPVWAFRIVDHRGDATTIRPMELPFLSSHRSECEAALTNAAEAREDASASDGRFVQLTQGTQLSLRHASTVWNEGLRWMLRARGKGLVKISAGGSAASLPIDSAGWVWQRVQVDPFNGTGDVTPVLECGEGYVDIDVALLASGTWPLPAPGEAATWPATAFHHAGRSDPADGTVAFDPQHNGPGLVMNGPCLPLEPGRYRFRVDITSPATAGTELGIFLLRHEGGPDLRNFPAVAGGDNSIVVSIDDGRPVMAAFAYHGRDACAVTRVHVDRLP